MYGAYTFSLTALLGFYFLSLPRELPLGNPAGCSSAGENSESIAVCGAVTSQKYRLCGNEREKSRSHLILRESRGWSSRFQPFVGRADERRFCCVTVVLPLVSILKTQCYNGSRKK